MDGRSSKLKLKLSLVPTEAKNILPHSKSKQVYQAPLESHLRYSDELRGKLDSLRRLKARVQTRNEDFRLKDG